MLAENQILSDRSGPLAFPGRAFDNAHISTARPSGAGGRKYFSLYGRCNHLQERNFLSSTVDPKPLDELFCCQDRENVPYSFSQLSRRRSPLILTVETVPPSDPRNRSIGAGLPARASKTRREGSSVDVLTRGASVAGAARPSSPSIAGFGPGDGRGTMRSMVEGAVRRARRRAAAERSCPEMAAQGLEKTESAPGNGTGPEPRTDRIWYEDASGGATAGRACRAPQGIQKDACLPTGHVARLEGDEPARGTVFHTQAFEMAGAQPVLRGRSRRLEGSPEPARRALPAARPEMAPQPLGKPRFAPGNGASSPARGRRWPEGRMRGSAGPRPGPLPQAGEGAKGPDR